MAEKSFKVIGAAVVLPLESGSERYLYRNAVVSGKGFTEEGLKHALKVGLIEETEPPAEDDDAAAAEKAASEKKAEADKVAAEKKAAAEKAASEK